MREPWRHVLEIVRSRHQLDQETSAELAQHVELLVAHNRTGVDEAARSQD